MEMALPLPEELLVEILTRLPVKSLTRFTCVSKHWLALIRSPEFGAKHYAKTRDYHHHPPSLMISSPEDASITFLSGEALHVSAAFQFRPVDSREPRHRALRHGDVVSYDVCGPCNGLFFLLVRRGHNRGVPVLWNPATREVFEIARPAHGGDLFNQVGFGFGFDHVANDYKIVAFSGDDDDVDVIAAQQYSLRAGRWGRTVDPGVSTRKGHLVDHVSTCNGRMYNWTLSDTETDKDCLLSYDMVDEVFVRTPLPGCIGHRSRDLVQQYPMDYPSHGPALVCYDFNEDCSGVTTIDFWVLSGYGEEGCWTMLRRFSLPEHVNDMLPPMELWRGWSILYTGEDGLVCCYDPDTREARSLRVEGRDKFCGYRESVVSIKGFVTNEQPQGSSSEAPAVTGEGSSAIEAAAFGVGEAVEVPPGEDGNDVHNNDLGEGECMDEDDGEEYDDYHVRDPNRDDEFYQEREYLGSLPYCLREVDQQACSNPCLF